MNLSLLTTSSEPCGVALAAAASSTSLESSKVVESGKSCNPHKLRNEEIIKSESGGERQGPGPGPGPAPALDEGAASILLLLCATSSSNSDSEKSSPPEETSTTKTKATTNRITLPSISSLLLKNQQLQHLQETKNILTSSSSSSPIMQNGQEPSIHHHTQIIQNHHHLPQQQLEKRQSILQKKYIPPPQESSSSLSPLLTAPPLSPGMQLQMQHHQQQLKRHDCLVRHTERYPCPSCQPTEWYTATAVLASKYEAFPKIGNRFEIHLLEFIQAYQIERVKDQCTLTHMTVHCLPRPYHKLYLESFQKTFFQPQPQQYPLQSEQKNHHQHQLVQGVPGQPRHRIRTPLITPLMISPPTSIGVPSPGQYPPLGSSSSSSALGGIGSSGNNSGNSSSSLNWKLPSPMLSYAVDPTIPSLSLNGEGSNTAGASKKRKNMSPHVTATLHQQLPPPPPMLVKKSRVTPSSTLHSPPFELSSSIEFNSNSTSTVVNNITTGRISASSSPVVSGNSNEKRNSASSSSSSSASKSNNQTPLLSAAAAAKAATLDDATPRWQPLRSENDLYTPRWVRFGGAKKEGLCGICEPDRWLQLKDSAFWYHKQFFHGISSTSGTYFTPPAEIRTVWNGVKSEAKGSYTLYLMSEGRCHQCNEWIALFKNKKRFSSSYQDFSEVESVIIPKSLDSDSATPITPAKLLSLDPLKIQVGRVGTSNALQVPSSIVVSPSLLKDIEDTENGEMSGVWHRHAHSCHQYASHEATMAGKNVKIDV